MNEINTNEGPEYVTLTCTKDGWVCGVPPYGIEADSESYEVTVSTSESAKLQYVSLGYFWKVVDGKLVEEKYGEIPYWVTVSELKSKLRSTDYQAIKFAEGQLTEEEFAPIRTQRQLWRDEINRLESLNNNTESQ